jgi:predicted nucleotidyltransferase
LALDIAVRRSLAEQVLQALRGAIAGSAAELRGSLAEGRADAWSDIDLVWEVPDERFETAVACVADALDRVRPVESLRWAPEFQRSDKRRLLFVQFEGVPLFWRVDIDLFAQSIHRDHTYDRDNEAAWGKDWSFTHSALMNAIAAVKALLRGQDEVARGLLERGFARVGLRVPAGTSQELILALVQGVAAIDPAMAGLACRIEALHRAAFASAGEG